MGDQRHALEDRMYAKNVSSTCNSSGCGTFLEEDPEKKNLKQIYKELKLELNNFRVEARKFFPSFQNREPGDLKKEMENNKESINLEREISDVSLRNHALMKDKSYSFYGLNQRIANGRRGRTKSS